ncbi:uncharacterized protein [Rutidosis leptorrhynchoides]|uniref:uncharacterized protein n=1 Tax=Rutidosis leptorrhynchoides TaxID=125765 RepID=UPI003A99A819
MREFFAYKIQEREIPTLVHLARKLQHQLLVDAYTMVESERIYYIRKNKKIQRADTFSNLTNVNLSGDVVNSMLGNRVKLPSSFTGCARALEGTCFNPEDKPAYQSRMFKIKLNRLMDDIKHNKIFGTVKLRGLPHAHICIFLDERDKLPDPEDIDEYIWAELPDKDEDPELYQLVSELMIHGPCDTNGYPVYKRRDNGRKVMKQGHELDNGYVVPDNPLLLKKYQAHINVEFCNQFGAIGYLFKYIHKGNDRVTAAVCDEDTDEIKQYYDCRYVSSCEAPIEDVLDNPSVNISQFLQWMKMNETNNDAKQLTYVEFPTKFVWNKDTRLWSPRKVFTGSIGRIHHVSPQTGELFFLRILLNKVKGPTCYEDIRTVNGIVCPTFKAACYEMGLLDDDQEYIEGIKEASTWGFGNWLRSFFAQLLLSESLSRPEDVFKKCFDYLVVDIIP